MSYIFDIDSETVWSPATRVGQMYISFVSVLAEIHRVPTGLHPTSSDMFQIDAPLFRQFVEGMWDNYFETEHPVYRRQMEGILMVSVVMLERIGATLEVRSATQQKFLAEARSLGRTMPR